MPNVAGSTGFGLDVIRSKLPPDQMAHIAFAHLSWQESMGLGEVRHLETSSSS